MSKIFVVVASEQYEGWSLVKAFTSKDDANNFARKCHNYSLTRPADPPDDEASDGVWEKWIVKEKRWGAKHPAGKENSSYPFFNVIDLELVA